MTYRELAHGRKGAAHARDRVVDILHVNLRRRLHTLQRAVREDASDWDRREREIDSGARPGKGDVGNFSFNFDRNCL